MKHGFVKVAAVTPDVRVADCTFNCESIIKEMKLCAEKGVKIAVFPELVITGYTCGELFLQDRLLASAVESLEKIIEAGKDLDMLVFVGLPFELDGKLYNVAAAIKDGQLLGLTAKKHIPEYSELYEARYFTPAPQNNRIIEWNKNGGEFVPFGNKLIFANEEMKNLKVAAEICEDLWVVTPPSNGHAEAGATLIVNLSGSPETAGKAEYRRNLVAGQSARLNAAYIYATSGDGESSTDLVFGGHNIIAENGSLLAEKKRFENGYIISEIDVDRLSYERRRTNTFTAVKNEDYMYIRFSFERTCKMPFSRKFSKTPFVPENAKESAVHCEEVITMQAMGLKKRLLHTGSRQAVVGLSGGLDSTLALIVVCKAFDLLGIDRKQILAVTMPCFGTTGRTYNNAVKLAENTGVTLKEIDIKEAVSLHLRDIGHDINIHDVTFENAQARERTQILMDLANKYNGIVIGTGDMSELALGFATYNGDHMSMYGVNSSVPKTLVRHLVSYAAEEERENNAFLAEVLKDIVETPVSPELLPPDKSGGIVQKTEEIVGPYELHDFFLYYVVRWGFEPDKIKRIACEAFKGAYEEEIIGEWLNSFYKRFFASQYKRSCMPDGTKVGSVSLSPRGDFRMPSDAVGDIWK